MRGDNAKGPGGYQFPDKTNCTTMFIIAVGTPQYYIEYHKGFVASFKFMNDLLEAFKFSIKEGFTVLQRITYAHAYVHIKGIKLKLAGTDHAACPCQHQVNAKGS